MLGHWKNFDELESSLSLEEIQALLEASRKKNYEDKKFLAAVNGVELDEEPDEESVLAAGQGPTARPRAAAFARE